MYCGEAVHWMLILFELLASHIVSYMLLPLVVRARVVHLYAATKKNDDYIVTR